jgi:aspartyl-tRNA(Asn)/glutamyl-tRNA(Gln) amidotransferase subunit A
MSQTDTIYLSVADASAQIESGALSPLDLTRAILDRIEATDGAINSYVLVMKDSALREAEAAEARANAGKRIGPLDGIPMGVKDLYDTGGVVTTGGTGAYRFRVPAQDSTAVAKLREAGAVIIGKTNTHELAFGGTTNNVHYGATHNPWNLERVPGGSSGGSGSALAAGQALGALGSDTGGSIRVPASCCGITGHKPTWGLVSRAGVIPMSHTLDHAGPMARSARDCALMLNVLQGYDARDLDTVDRPAEDYTAGIEDGVAGMTFAVIPSLLANITPGVKAAFEASLATFESLGATITTIEPMIGYDDWRSDTMGIVQVESYDYHESLMDDEPPSIGAAVRSRIAPGATIPAHKYSRALDMRKQIEHQFDRTLKDNGIDAYLLPTTPLTAWPIDPDPHRDESPPIAFQNTMIFDLSHQPAISVPNGFDSEGLPTSLMISAAKWEDAKALRIAHAFQTTTDFHTKRPSM